MIYVGIDVAKDNGKLQCRGKVYLGVSKEERAVILKFAKKNTVKRPWFENYKNVVWLKPELVGTAHFMHETESGGMRQPVWKGLRDDKCFFLSLSMIDIKQNLKYNKNATY